MEKTARSKVIMNEEQLLFFVENKREEEFRRDSLLPENKSKRRDSLLPVETESRLKHSMVKIDLSKVYITDEERSRAIESLFSLVNRNSKKKMLVEQDSAPSI